MGKISVGDLSIGDWVQDANGKYAQILGIENWSDGYVLNVKINGVDVGYVSALSAHPIPITPEILEKNGLEYIDDGNDAVIFLCCDMFLARLCVGDTFWQEGIHSEDRLDAVVCNVKHIHELQHVLRLAKVGKEIVL